MRPWLAVPVIACLLLAACGDDGDGAGSPSATASAVPSSTPVATAAPGDAAAVPAWHSFHIEATVRARSNAETAGTNVTPASGFAHVTDSTVRWWSQSLEFFRQELTVQEDGGDPALTLVIGDGTQISVYDQATNSYQHNSFPADTGGLVAVPIPASIVLGPPTEPDDNAPFEAAVAFLQSVTQRPEGLVDKGEDLVAGRKTRVYETGPAGCFSTADGSGTECRGTVTAWVDEETGFFLRYEAEDPGVQDIVVEVTSIEYAPAFGPALFEFSPPSGAVEATP